MNLQPVSKSACRPNFVACCVRCGRPMSTACEPIYMDLDGKAFVDYYCAACVLRLPVLPVIRCQGVK